MPILLPAHEPVPFDQVAEVLAEAASRWSGGPAAAIGASGRHLAHALEQAGFKVVRDAGDGRQLTL